jgi:uncharacterized protein
MESATVDYSGRQTNDSTPERNLGEKSGKKPAVGFMLIVLALAAVLLFTLSSKNGNTSNPALVNNEVTENTADLSPTPFPFQELTIPYLRTQKFESKLAELTEISQNSIYTAYLTSYQSDDFKINGLLTKPVGEVPNGGWPAIVFIHGYIPPAQYRTLGPQYADYVDYLSRNGFVVFKIDLRGNGDSEGEAGGAYYSSDYVIDTLNAYSALGKLDYVNPEKIGLWGHSMAGNIVLRSMSVNPSIPAGVIWAGAVYTYEDMGKYGIQDSSFDRSMLTGERGRRRAEMRNLYGEPDLTHFFWKNLAPVSFLSDLKGAVQLNHAVDDNVVNIGYSRDLNSILDKTSVPHELNEYPSGGHDIEGVSFTRAMENTVEFFSKYLKR